jgi:Lon protease-like protein
MVLPLHVFEERYRQLVQDLLDGPEPRRFGVIAIREGRETGANGVASLYDVGCIAALRDADRHDDGRFDLVTVGTERFRLGQVDRSRPYLQAEVEPIPDDVADPQAAEFAVHVVREGFRGYLDALVKQGGATVVIEEIPDEPVLLSYVIAAAMIIDLPERQALLAEPDAVSRLLAERTLLIRETAMLRATTTRPAPDLRYTNYSPN